MENTLVIAMDQFQASAIFVTTLITKNISDYTNNKKIEGLHIFIVCCEKANMAGGLPGSILSNDDLLTSYEPHTHL